MTTFKLFFLSAALTGLLVTTAAAAPSPLAGLTTLDGAPFDVKPAKANALVVFWATWCDECRAKLNKELVDLDRRADVSVLTVNADKDAKRAADFVAKEHVVLPVLRDETKAVRRALGVFSVPHWALYRRSKTDGSLELVTAEAAFDMNHVVAALSGAKP